MEVLKHQIEFEKLFTAEDGSILITDGWKGYTGISEKGYQHTIEDNSKMLDGHEVLPNIYRIASLVKK